MHIIDYVVIGLFLVFLMALGTFLSKRAGENTDEFILAGRKLPWWLAGTSMLAVGLNASTMLQDARKVRQDGISGMWFTWAKAASSIISTIFFLRLWRRGRFVTQMEFYQARYKGWPAVFARVYDSGMYGIALASVWAAIGLVGMKKIITVLIPMPETVHLMGLSCSSSTLVVIALVAVTLFYSVASGVYGVVWTDLIEFGIAMLCALILLFYVYNDVGWNVGLREQIESVGAEGSKILTILPKFGPVLIYFFIVFPFVSQGGYQPNVQRYLAVKDEREVLFTGIYSFVVSICLRMWPYLLVGLAGLILVPNEYLMEHFQPIITPEGEAIGDYEKVYPLLALRYLPVGVLGLMMAGFLSAFMSSFDSNIHNSASIFINDVYRPYLAKGRSEKQYVRATRLYMVFITVVSTIIGIYVHDILLLTMAALSLTHAAGLVKVMRFLWWRVNGKAEVFAQITALFTVIYFLSPLGSKTVVAIMKLTGYHGNDAFFVYRQLTLLSFSSIASLLAIFLFPAEPMEHLCAFYQRVRPFGWWGPVQRACGVKVGQPEPMRPLWVLFVSTCMFIYGLLFVVFGFSLAYFTIMLWSLLITIIGSLGIVWSIRTIYPRDSGVPAEEKSA